jgi:adenylate cyclase class 2
MKTEFEVKFYPVDKAMIIANIKKNGGRLIQPETKNILVIYGRQINPYIDGHYVRVRDEGNKVRLSVKVHASKEGSIADQKEIDTIVSDFDATVEILERSGLKRSGYQEKMRETWLLGTSEVVIDTWPGLETYIEIEDQSEDAVRSTAEVLGFNWKDKIITSVVEVYMDIYDLSREEVLKLLENTTFANNPFAAYRQK